MATLLERLGFSRNGKAVVPAHAREAEYYVRETGELDLETIQKSASEDFARAAYGSSLGPQLPRVEATEGLDAYSLFSWVNACVRKIAESAAGLNIRCVQKTRDGEKEDLPEDHPLCLLFDAPNRFQTKFEFIEGLLTNMETTGEGFILLGAGNRDIRPLEPPDALYLLRPDRMTINPDDTLLIRDYLYQAGASVKTFKPHQIVYHKYLDPSNDYRGLSPIAALRRAIISEDRIIEWNNKFFENSARPDFVLQSDQKVDADSKKTLIGKLLTYFRGYLNAHKFLVLDQGLKAQFLNFPPKDIEWLLQRGYNLKEILAIFGVPPVVIGLMDEAIRANAKEQYVAFWMLTMIPKLTRLAEKLTNGIAHRFGPDLSCEFDVTTIEALKEGATEKVAWLVALRNAGVLTGNEVRAEMGWDEIKAESDEINSEDEHEHEDSDDIDGKAMAKPKAKSVGDMLLVVGGRFVDPEGDGSELIPPPPTLLGPDGLPMGGMDPEDPDAPPGKKPPPGEEEDERKPPVGEKEKGFATVRMPLYPSQAPTTVSNKAYRRLARRAYAGQSKQFATKYVSAIEKAFAKQRDRVLTKFRKDFGIEHKDHNDEERTRHLGDWNPFSSSDEAKAFMDALGPVYLASIFDAGQESIDSLVESASTFKQSNDRIREYISTRVGEKIAFVTDETKAQVREIVLAGFNRGDSIDTIAQALKAKFDQFSSNTVVDPVTGETIANFGRFTRADMIARTEVNAALAFGAREGAQQAVDAGAELFKSWLSMRDSEVRDEHAGIDDETADNPIPFDQAYSNGAMYPHDSDLPPESLVNCRCRELTFPAKTAPFIPEAEPAGAGRSPIGESPRGDDDLATFPAGSW